MTPTEPSTATTDTVVWWRRHATWLAVAIVAVVVALPLGGLMRASGPPMEEGFMLVFPERVLAGDIPNRDFLHLYGPGSLWSLAAAFRVFGTSLETERLFGLAQHLAVVSGIFLLARRWGRPAAAACAALAVVILVPATRLTALAWTGGVGLALLALVALLCASAATDTRRAGRRALGAGVLGGAALLFRADLVIALGLSAAVVAAGATPLVRRRAAAGLTVGLVGYLVHLAIAGPGNVFRGMFVDPVFNLRAGRRLPLPPDPDRFDGFLQRAAELDPPDWPLPALSAPAQLTLWLFCLLGSVAFVVAVGWLVRYRWAQGSHRGLVLWAASLFGLGLLPQALQRVDSAHFAVAGCVSMALLPIATVEVLRRRVPGLDHGRAMALAIVGSFAVVVIAIPRFTVTQYVDDVRHTLDADSGVVEVSNDGRRFLLGRADAAAALTALIEDLDAISSPGDTLFVGTSDLRFTPYNDAYIYHLFPDLDPATYHIEMEPGIANAADSGLAEELRAADFVILSSLWDDWDEPNDSMAAGSDEPNRVVAEAFCDVGEYDGLFRLLERCDRT